MELNIEKFNPTVSQLQEIAKMSKSVDVTDLKAVKEVRIKLKTARVEITKQGKAMRDDANAFAKLVISKEKELVAIIEPEEERLEAIEEEAKEKKMREERVALLPVRREQLEAIGDDIIITNDELLEMDTETFSAYKNDRIAQKNEADRLALEAEKRKVQEEADRQQREKETRESEEKCKEKNPGEG
jgi:hypothetical protein